MIYKEPLQDVAFVSAPALIVQPVGDYFAIVDVAKAVYRTGLVTSLYVNITQFQPFRRADLVTVEHIKTENTGSAGFRI